MAAQDDQERFSATLPVSMVELVLSHHSGDAATLCAAACVARAWSAAAAQPRLWRALLFEHDKDTVFRRLERLTDERLAALVARAGGALERLICLDDTTADERFRVTHAVTAGGVVSALRGNAPLQELRLRGVRADGATFAELRALVALGGALDITDGATCGIPTWCQHLETPCGRLCSAEADLVCEDCGTFCCVHCRRDLVLLPCCAKCENENCGYADFDALTVCYLCSATARQSDARAPYKAFCVSCVTTCAFCEIKDRTMCHECCGLHYCEMCNGAFCEECWLKDAWHLCFHCDFTWCFRCEEKEALEYGAGILAECHTCYKQFCCTCEESCLAPKGTAAAGGKRPKLYCTECLAEESDDGSGEA